jgi:hypothetical protein
MIKYTLKCESGHSFESWFQSADSFEGLRAAGHVTCVECGSAHVEKAIMAPRIGSKSKSADTPELAKPATPTEEKIAELRKHVEENSTYVGGSFAKEARAMHLGDAPERSIWGEAKPSEAKALLEDGVPVAPLPFVAREKTN